MMNSKSLIESSNRRVGAENIFSNFRIF